MLKLLKREKSITNKSFGWHGMLAAALVASAAATATAQESLPYPSRLNSIVVNPLVADIDVPRAITVSGTWPHACPPLSASVVSADTSTTNTVVVSLAVPQTLVACAQVLTPYTLSAGYTPHVRGKLRLLVVTNDGQYLGESVLDTRGANDNRSLYDITGVWYDPATNGSGLTFIHSRTNDNAVFGTWYVYDPQGKSRWYSIQNVQWKQQGKVLEGAIYESLGKPVTCPAPFTACPVELGSAVSVGTARITLNGPSSALVEAIGPQGNVLFSSNLSKIGL